MIVLSIGFTQLQIGTEVIPIIVAGIMATITLTIGIGLRDEIKNYLTVEALKQDGINKETKITYDGKEYEIINLGITHVKVKNDDKISFIHNSLWTPNFDTDLKE